MPKELKYKKMEIKMKRKRHTNGPDVELPSNERALFHLDEDIVT
jgi:hypothetical protein